MGSEAAVVGLAVGKVLSGRSIVSFSYSFDQLGLFESETDRSSPISPFSSGSPIGMGVAMVAGAVRVSTGLSTAGRLLRVRGSNGEPKVQGWGQRVRLTSLPYQVVFHSVHWKGVGSWLKKATFER